MRRETINRIPIDAKERTILEKLPTSTLGKVVTVKEILDLRAGSSSTSRRKQNPMEKDGEIFDNPATRQAWKAVGVYLDSEHAAENWQAISKWKARKPRTINHLAENVAEAVAKMKSREKGADRDEIRIFGRGPQIVEHEPAPEPVQPALPADWEERCTFTDEEIEEEERFENEEPPHLTDLGNAQRFRHMHIKNVRHSVQLGWLIWDGSQWLRDGTQENERLARGTVKSIYQEAADCDDKDFRQKLAEWASKCESMQKINAMLTLAESEPGIAVRAEIFDRNPWLFNVDNGTLDLRTGELKPHSRDDLLTKITPIVYDRKASYPTWRAFLERIFAGNSAVIRYVQKVAGYGMTADTREHELYIAYGLGANGKTTLIKTLLQVFGEYGIQSPVETFLVKRNGGGIPNDVARLAGARFVAAMESEANQRLAESLVKALTGGDRIAARFLHREFFEFTPAFKLILSTNHKPRIIGSDHAIWRRIRLIPFDVTIPKDEQDKTLPQKLEAELSGILNWCVEGCLRWQQEGLQPPPEVVGASESYRQEMDTLGEFLEACCVINSAASVTAKDLYAAYVQWSEGNKDKGLSRVTFGQAMSERGFKAGRNWQGRFWQGVGLMEP